MLSIYIYIPYSSRVKTVTARLECLCPDSDVTNVKYGNERMSDSCRNLIALVNQVVNGISSFKKIAQVTRTHMVICGSKMC